MRGYQKKVIYMKNTGSKHFEEAYFVLKSDIEKTGISCNEMIDEANRIIEENFDQNSHGFLYSVRWYIIAFLIGSAVTFAISATVGLFLG